MGAKKDRDVNILTHKEDKFKELAKNFKKYGISQRKIDVIEAKEAHYKAWKNKVIAKPDY